MTKGEAQVAHETRCDAKRSKIDGQHNEFSPDSLRRTNAVNPAHTGTVGQEDPFFVMRKPLPFEYQPLDLGAHSIRVVEIIPGPEQAIIQCNMRNTHIEEEEYVCLSYTWEPNNPSHEIEINGEIGTIGDNLWHFLYAARLAGIKEPLWIDALCINQLCNIEKNHQVALMSKIYAGAQKALIWLGVSIMDGTLRNFSSEIIKCGETLFWSSSPSEILKQVSKMVNDINPTLKASFSAGIVQCLSLPYWSRIWIIQEVMLPSKKQIFSGIGEVMLTLLAYVVDYFVTFDLFDTDIWSLPGFRLIRSQRTFHYGGLDDMPETTLLPLIRAFGYSGCSNKLDRVYALLSLAQNGHQFTIDYNVDSETLFRRTMLFFMDNRPLDDFLLAGAALIETLEIRPIRTPATIPNIRDAIQSAKPTSSMDKTGGPCLLIHYDRAISVASPVWGEALLDTADNSGHLLSRDATPCLYLAIYDAGDIHIFEYAVEEDKSGVSVKYARAHEYIRGKPQIYNEPLNISDDESYLWVDLPSEKVHYYRLPSGTQRHPRVLPDLIEWTAPQLKLKELPTVSFDDHSATAELQPRRLKPAKRYLALEMPWEMPWNNASPIRAVRLFRSILSDIWRNELALQLQCHKVDESGIKLEISGCWKLPFRPPASGDSGLKLSPQTPRSATLRLKHIDRDSKEGNSVEND